MLVIKYFFQWISRTVMVKNNDVDEAMQILNGIMMREGLTKRWKGTRVYEKPTWVGIGIILCHCDNPLIFQARNRVNYEKCRAIYDEDMRNKIRFIMRKNRENPYPGC